VWKENRLVTNKGGTGETLALAVCSPRELAFYELENCVGKGFVRANCIWEVGQARVTDYAEGAAAAILFSLS